MSLHDHMYAEPCKRERERETFYDLIIHKYQSQGQSALRHRSVSALMLELRFQIPLRACKFVFVFVVYCAGSDLYDGLITPSERSYSPCVSRCVWFRNLEIERLGTELGCFATKSIAKLTYRPTSRYPVLFCIARLCDCSVNKSQYKPT